MTRRFSLLMVMVMVLAGSVLAQPLSVRYSLVQTTRPPVKKLMDNASWRQELESPACKVLDSGSCSATWKEEAYAFMGRKLPIPYYDPRAEASQVQYTDVGFKIDCKPRPLANGLIELEVRIEKTQLVEADGNATSGFITDTRVVMKRGQTAVLSTTRGLATKTYLGAAYPNLPFDEATTVMIVLTLD